jgi:hypothetical protein
MEAALTLTRCVVAAGAVAHLNAVQSSAILNLILFRAEWPTYPQPAYRAYAAFGHDTLQTAILSTKVFNNSIKVTT